MACETNTLVNNPYEGPYDETDLQAYNRILNKGKGVKLPDGRNPFKIDFSWKFIVE